MIIVVAYIRKTLKEVKNVYKCKNILLSCKI
jgi:hypothetical protein